MNHIFGNKNNVANTKTGKRTLEHPGRDGIDLPCEEWFQPQILQVCGWPDGKLRVDTPFPGFPTARYIQDHPDNSCGTVRNLREIAVFPLVVLPGSSLPFWIVLNSHSRKSLPDKACCLDMARCNGKLHAHHVSEHGVMTFFARANLKPIYKKVKHS